MQRSDFTPGPWVVVPYGDGNALVICTESDGNWRICFLATPGDSYGAWETIKADARLIAASPTMYEALAEINRQCEIADDPDHHTLGLIKHISHDALAKAHSLKAQTVT